MELADGRVLAADDVGDPAGVPVLYLHGAPDCRLARHPDDGWAAAGGVRLVAVDRPGYGWSEPQAGRPDPVAWGRDVEVLLDSLGLDRCRMVAWSAGAPWAFGVAAALGERIERVIGYGALAPFEAFADGGVAAASGPRADLAAEVAAGGDLEVLAREVTAMLVPVPPVDLDTARDILLDSYGELARTEVGRVPGALDWLARSLAAAVDRYGDAGVRADLLLQFAPGLVELFDAVRCAFVLVHGGFDPIAGPAVGRWLADRLPTARVEVWPDAGHQGLLPRWTDLLSLAGG